MPFRLLCLSATRNPRRIHFWGRPFPPIDTSVKIHTLPPRGTDVLGFETWIPDSGRSGFRLPFSGA